MAGPKGIYPNQGGQAGNVRVWRTSPLARFWTKATTPDARDHLARDWGGPGWALWHLSTPLLMGLVAQYLGLVAGFWAAGERGLAAAFAVTFTPQWAFASQKVAQ